MPRIRTSPPDGREDDHRKWMRAALEGRTEIIKALLAKGADVDEKDNWGRTALMFATINLHRDTVRTLLESGAEVNVRANDGATALMLAACAGDIGIVRALLARRANVEGKFISTGKTAAMLAADHGFDEVAQLIRAIEGRATLRIHAQSLAEPQAENELVEIRNQITQKPRNHLSDPGAGILSCSQGPTSRGRSSAEASDHAE